MARCLAYRLMVMSARDRELVGVDSYLKVRALLTEIWADPAGSFFSVEGGEIRARGVELEAKAALSASINV
ncbi:cytoplasmic protein, partial [Salmonella enterica subsp. enterica serovar Enteritidis str. 13183-1]